MTHCESIGRLCKVASGLKELTMGNGERWSCDFKTGLAKRGAALWRNSAFQTNRPIRISNRHPQCNRRGLESWRVSFRVPLAPVIMICTHIAMTAWDSRAAGSCDKTGYAGEETRLRGAT